jgi:single-strand DNA-binding protein
MLNYNAFVGRLTRDPDFRELSGDNAVIRFSIAVQRDFRNQKGEFDADFIPCTAWGNKARIYRDHLYKGALVSVRGAMRSSVYEDPGTNKKIYSLDLQVDAVDFLDPKKKAEDEGFKLAADPLK